MESKLVEEGASGRMSLFGFDHHTRSFSLRNAYHSALAAELAYAEPDTMERTVIDQWRCRDFAYFDESGTQAFVASNAHSVVVSFRGTEQHQIEDWITDVDMELVGGPLEGKVHVGFYDALSKVWEQIRHRVNRCDRDRSKTIWVTGHSLGGALATMAVARWVDQDRPIHGLYSFGQPRSGDRTFARNFNFRFKPYAFRMVNHSDLVTRIPPQSFGYSHVGTFHYFPDVGEIDSDMGWWNRFLESWKVQIEDVIHWGTNTIQAHKMSSYLHCLEQAIVRDQHSFLVQQDVNRFLRTAVTRKKSA